MNNAFSSSLPLREDTQSATELVVDAQDASPLNLEPLAHVVDPDALDAFVEGTPDSDHDSTGNVTFAYSGYDVTVTTDGRVTLDERPG